MPAVKKSTKPKTVAARVLPGGYTTAEVTIIDLNAIAPRRTIPADGDWPAIVQISYTTNLSLWNLERHDGTAWLHLGRVARGAAVNVHFNDGEIEPRWRLVEVPA